MRSSKHKLRCCLRWEMQTGVMAYRRNERVTAFWEETRKVAHARQTQHTQMHPPSFPAASAHKTTRLRLSPA